MSEAVRLSVKFLTEIKGFERDTKDVIKAPNSYKDIVWKTFEKLLGGGTNAGDMIAWMDKYKEIHKSPKDAYTMDDVITYLQVSAHKGTKQRDPNNLLEEGRFYYHPALQIAPPPPVIEVLDDGTFKSSYEEDDSFYLEIKESFVLEDLIDYFYKRIPIHRKRVEADKGAFKYMLKSLDLDVILYCIDEASVQDGLPHTVFDIEDYVAQATLILEDRKNTLFEVGLDHVIPK